MADAVISTNPDEEKKKKLFEQIQKLWKSLTNFLWHLGDKSVYESIKKCEEALDELEQRQDVSLETLEQLVTITSDLSDRIQTITPENIQDVQKKLDSLLKETENLKEKTESEKITVVTEDFARALSDVFGGADYPLNPDIYMSDTDVYVLHNGKAAKVELIQTEGKDEIKVSLADLSAEETEALRKTERMENDRFETPLLRALAEVNKIRYEASVASVQSISLFWNDIINQGATQISDDGKTECIFLKDIMAFRVRDIESGNMLEYRAVGNDRFDARMYLATESLTDSNKEAVNVGTWKNTKEGVKGKFVSNQDIGINHLMQSQFSRIYMEQIAGTSGDRIACSLEIGNEVIGTEVNSERVQHINALFTEIQNIAYGSGKNWTIKNLTNKDKHCVLIETEQKDKYYINFDKDGHVKNHRFKSHKSGKNEPSQLVESNGRILNEDVYRDQAFIECYDIAKHAESTLLIESENIKTEPVKPQQRGIEH